MLIQHLFVFFFPSTTRAASVLRVVSPNNLPLQLAITALAAKTEDKPVVVKPSGISKCFIESYH